jgi:hypothetical protein
VARQKPFQRANLAAGMSAATVVLAHHDELGVVILPEVKSSGGSLVAQGGLAKLLELGVSGGRRTPAVPNKDSGSVGVNDERRSPAGIEQHAVSGLGPDSVDGQKPVPGLPRGALPQRSKVAVVLADQHFEKSAEPAGFHPEKAGRAYEVRQLGLGEFEQSAGFEEMARAEVLEGPLDIGPAGILSEDRADADFERSFTRPPSLMTEVAPQQFVGATQGAMGAGGVAVRSGHVLRVQLSGLSGDGQLRGNWAPPGRGNRRTG